MKRILNLLLLLMPFLGFSQFGNDQLQEMVIEQISKNQVAKIVQKIKSKAHKNYDQQTNDYLLKQFTILNQKDTLVKYHLLYNISIDLPGKKINKTLKTSTENKEFLNSDFFKKYPGSNDSPLYWFTDLVLRKYINITALDFFNNLKDYRYNKSKEKNATTIHFISDKFYEGSFTYDKWYRLQKIIFKLNEPYYIDHSQSKNGKSMFVKNWNYTQEQVEINFKNTNDNDFQITSLKVLERMKNYNFIRLNSKGDTLVEDKNLEFTTNLLLKRKQ